MAGRFDLRGFVNCYQSLLFQKYPAMLYTNTIWIESFFAKSLYMYVYIYARPPTTQWQSQLPSLIPSWMNELGTPYFGCSMIYVQ